MDVGPPSTLNQSLRILLQNFLFDISLEIIWVSCFVSHSWLKNKSRKRKISLMKCHPVSIWRKITLGICESINVQWSDHSNWNYNADWWYLWSDNLTILSHLSWSGLVRSWCSGHYRGSQQLHIFINWQLCHLEPWDQLVWFPFL